LEKHATSQKCGHADPDYLFTLAAINAAHRQYKRALEFLRTLEEADPNYPGLWRLRAKVYELMGDVENAALCWEKGRDGLA